jgi:hypothetical protein
MRRNVGIARLVLAVLVTAPLAAAAHGHGQPAEFPRWRGAPELTVYAPPPPRLDELLRAQPVAAQPAPPMQTFAPRPC